MSIPESIKSKRPTQFGAVEIRYLGGYYYTYLVSSKWDPKKNRSQKKTGKCIGKITEADGFIPNLNGFRLMNEKQMLPKTAPIVKNYGAYEVLQQLSSDINEQLKKHFPECFREIRTIALLRVVDKLSSTKMIQPIFLDSYMSDLCNDIAVSENSVRNFIAKLGSLEERTETYMRDQIMPGATLMFDGTTIFWKSSDSLSAKGYNSDHSREPQGRILYVFEKNTHKPVFFRVFQGSVVDKSAFIETLRAAGCENCTIIADKGFYSKKNLAALEKANIKYILPLQENTANVEDEFYDNKDDTKWDGVFTYKKRAIWYRKKKKGNNGNIVYTFRDDDRKAELVGNRIAKTEKENVEADIQIEDVLKEKRLGYFSFYSNVNTTAKNIYMSYKERWDIEEFFDYLKNSVSSSASYAHSDAYFRGWAFVNHISMCYYYGLLNALREHGLNTQYTAENIISLTKNIYRVDDGSEEKKISAIPKKTQEILKTIGVDLLRKF